MNPDEKELLRRVVKVSEDNNRLLRSLVSTARWSTIWGFIKFLIVVVPLIIGYLFLQPYLSSMFSTYQEVQGLIDSPDNTQRDQTSSLDKYKSKILENVVRGL